ncbi:MAG: S-layer homology domain-containing protein [Clostridia bacterium]|nr:S-layer homology domain-containing protein [Clostridia bacterium]
MTKKKYVCLAVFLILLLSLFGIYTSSLAANTTTSHTTHSYTIQGSKISSATCTAAAKYTYYCSCGKSTIKSVGSSLGHNYAAATCTKPKTCTRCGVTSGSSLGHSPGTVWKSNSTQHYKTCQRCLLNVSVANHNSSGSRVSKSATCTAAGTKEIYCTICNKVTSTQSIAALGHSYKAATCTEAQTCTRCNVKVGGPLGHSYAAATCLKPKTCTRCGATSGNALGHSYKAATCTEAQTCTRCNVKVGGPLGHSYAAATCTTAKKCTRCGVTSGSALGHSAGTIWMSDANQHYKLCQRCNIKLNAGNHGSYKYSNGNATTHKKTCGTCGYVTTETHNNVTKRPFDSTHHTYSCNSCGYSIKQDCAFGTTGVCACGNKKAATVAHTHSYKITNTKYIKIDSHQHQKEVTYTCQNTTGTCDKKTYNVTTTEVHNNVTRRPFDATHHTYECKSCGYTEKQVCDFGTTGVCACGNTKNTIGNTGVTSHTHSYKITNTRYIKIDSHQHQKEVTYTCQSNVGTCNKRTYVVTTTEAHNNVTRRPFDATHHTYECKLCGYTEKQNCDFGTTGICLCGNKKPTTPSSTTPHKEDPSKEILIDPGQGQEQNPGKQPETNPGQEQEQNPGQEQEQNPGKQPETNPGQEQEQTPQATPLQVDVNAKMNGVQLADGSQKEASLGDAIELIATPKENVAAIIYFWDKSEPIEVINDASGTIHIPDSFELGSTHKLYVQSLANDGNASETKVYTFIIPNPVDQENNPLEVLPWEEENFKMRDISILLRNDSESTKSNKNVYAINENVTYYIDFKNGGIDITEPVTIRLNIPLDFEVIQNGGGTVDSNSRTITWIYSNGMVKNYSGTKKVVLRYTALNDKSVNAETIYPLAQILAGNEIKDHSAVINFIYLDSNTVINAIHLPYMYGDLNAPTFRPDDTITRAEGALVLARILLGQDVIDNTEVSYVFPDITETYEEAQKAITACTEFGIINGFTDGTYKPNRTMTRAEFMKILAKFIEINYTNNGIQGLEIKDIEQSVKLYNNPVSQYIVNGQIIENHWAIEEISLLYRLNMTPISAKEKDLRIDNGITRAEVAQLVNFYLLRAPAEMEQIVDTAFEDVSMNHKLVADIVEATRPIHLFRITKDGKEIAE